MNATHLKLGRKLGRKSNGIGNGSIYIVRRDRKVISSLRKSMKLLEEATDGWEDASLDVTERIKADLGRNTSKVLDTIERRVSGTSTTGCDGTIRSEAPEATLVAILDKLEALEALVN